MIGCILLSSNVSSIVTLPRLGPRVLITTGMLFSAGAMTYLAQLTVTSSYVGGVLPGAAGRRPLIGMIFAPAINTATAGVPAPGLGRGLRAGQHDAAGRRIDRDLRAEHRRADRDGQLPRRASHGAAGAGDRGHPWVHHGLYGVRGDLRSRRNPRDRPAARQAAAGTTQGRCGRGRSCAPRRRTRVRRHTGRRARASRARIRRGRARHGRARRCPRRGPRAAARRRTRCTRFR